MIPGKYSIEIIYNTMIRLLFTALFLVTTSANCQSSDNEDFRSSNRDLVYAIFIINNSAVVNLVSRGIFKSETGIWMVILSKKLIGNGLTFKPRGLTYYLLLGMGTRYNREYLVQMQVERKGGTEYIREL